MYALTLRPPWKKKKNSYPVTRVRKGISVMNFSEVKDVELFSDPGFKGSELIYCNDAIYTRLHLDYPKHIVITELVWVDKKIIILNLKLCPSPLILNAYRSHDGASCLTWTPTNHSKQNKTKNLSFRTTIFLNSYIKKNHQFSSRTYRVYLPDVKSSSS